MCDNLVEQKIKSNQVQIEMPIITKTWSSQELFERNPHTAPNRDQVCSVQKTTQWIDGLMQSGR